MSTITQELENAIGSLISEGKEPSVALIKSRLANPLPIPVIIKALQAWKKNTKVPTIEKQTKELTADERITQLEQQIITLSTRLAKLEAQQ
ncbi:hypothetical protein [Photobacterium angustum]|uniref:hypothetical protein n=1 Tax=Photobacterium angustum TaxID=661 RepID=UPI0005DC8D42|nr:hypothetical protein [Photobacterium angustum]KJG15546.1 hypothetical protein UA33_19150 [Photobacterium angustum]KJG20776.1 hypothetical protein UA39_19160 [Photobacterium angustum]KJG27712.1 hypothetical protein UA36_19525 [Photobacterium angustum]PSW93006.1 hypothetical protein C0W79_19050 [Photobacterium angustum]PSX01087.1 hypothetical protein C0W87_15040 [Photobacterium angustum]